MDFDGMLFLKTFSPCLFRGSFVYKFSWYRNIAKLFHHCYHPALYSWIIFSHFSSLCFFWRSLVRLMWFSQKKKRVDDKKCNEVSLPPTSTLFYFYCISLKLCRFALCQNSWRNFVAIQLGNLFWRRLIYQTRSIGWDSIGIRNFVIKSLEW